jgi:hypothetical protein
MFSVLEIMGVWFLFGALCAIGIGPFIDHVKVKVNEQKLREKQ